MKELYGQKQVPNIIIQDVCLDCLVDFELYFDSGDYIEITCTSPILPKGAKKLLLSNGALGQKMKIIEPTRQCSDGADVDVSMLLAIRHYTFNYTLTPEGEPANYHFTFKCEYYGQN